MFTGFLPEEHGVRNNTQILGEDAVTIAEILQRRGFATAGVISLGNLQKRFGFAQGFDSFDGRFANEWFLPADVISDRAIALLHEIEKERFFLFVHYSDPHEPYTPPTQTFPEMEIEVNGELTEVVRADGYSKRIPLTLHPGENRIQISKGETPTSWAFIFRNIGLGKSDLQVELGSGWNKKSGSEPGKLAVSSLPADLRIWNPRETTSQQILRFMVLEEYDLETIQVRYREEVSFVDREIGRLFEEIRRRGLFDKSLIILTSDHGEGLGDHDLAGHIHQVYDSLIHVPLIVSMPGRPEGARRVREAVSHVDIVPTILDLLDVDQPNFLHGKSLRGLLTGSNDGSNGIHLAATYRPEARADLEALIQGRFKLISDRELGRSELYDLEDDPRELLDLAPDRPAVVSKLGTILAAQTSLFGGDTATERQLTPEEREALEALGYLQ
jgi:arylsulfatase A-like enzyme